jgi:hypothetical protein
MFGSEYRVSFSGCLIKAGMTENFAVKLYVMFLIYAAAVAIPLRPRREILTGKKVSGVSVQGIFI